MDFGDKKRIIKKPLMHVPRVTTSANAPSLSLAQRLPGGLSGSHAVISVMAAIYAKKRLPFGTWVPLIPFLSFLLLMMSLPNARLLPRT